MALTMAGNYINVGPNSRCFEVATNYCDYFELGVRLGDDYWLEGEMVGPRLEFVFNGRIFLPGVTTAGTVIDNFPKGPVPAGWTKVPNMHGDGYRLLDSMSRVLFGYEVKDGRICHVTANIYAKDGSIVAESLPDQFRLQSGHPALLGRGGVCIS